jgi:hypothetical protein
MSILTLSSGPLGQLKLQRIDHNDDFGMLEFLFIRLLYFFEVEFIELWSLIDANGC